MNDSYDTQSNRSGELKPRYSTVEKLKSLIASENFAPGTRLPSERDLTDRFKITRANLRKAFDILEREGVIWRHVGKGTFIAEPHSEKSILNISELVNELTPVQLLRARLSIEPAIAREAAIHASEADVSRIDAACNAASSATSWSEYERADDLLHHEIAAAAHPGDFFSISFKICWFLRSNSRLRSLSTNCICPTNSPLPERDANIN